MAATMKASEEQAPTINQVRELLFGEQIRALTTDWQSREEAARDEQRRRADAFESRLQALQAQHDADCATLSNAVAGLHTLLTEKANALETMIDQRATTQANMLTTAETALRAKIDGVLEALESSKVGRQVMAGLLESMAKELSDAEVKTPPRKSKSRALQR